MRIKAILIQLLSARTRDWILFMLVTVRWTQPLYRPTMSDLVGLCVTLSTVKRSRQGISNERENIYLLLFANFCHCVIFVVILAIADIRQRKNTMWKAPSLPAHLFKVSKLIRRYFIRYSVSDIRVEPFWRPSFSVDSVSPSVSLSLLCHSSLQLFIVIRYYVASNI